MLTAYDRLFVERCGEIAVLPSPFHSDEELMDFVSGLLATAGRELNQAVPYADGNVGSGLRLSATIPPFSAKPTLTLRRHQWLAPTRQEYQAMTGQQDELDRLEQAVAERRNIIVIGRAGSGKTTLLRVLARFVPAGERIITLEETLELGLDAIHPHVVALETRPPNKAGNFAISADQALRHVLHMRPDRIVLGELRHGEALQLLAALGSGHPGGFTTLHADGPTDAFDRLLFLMMLSQHHLSETACTTYLHKVVDVIVTMERLTDGRRRIASITEVGTA